MVAETVGSLLVPIFMQDPTALTDSNFDQTVLNVALRMARNPALDAEDRAYGAEIASCVLMHLQEPPEDVITETMRSAVDCIDAPSALNHLIRVVPWLVPDRCTLTAAFSRLARKCFDAGRVESLAFVLLVMLETPCFARAIEDLWAKNAAEWALRQEAPLKWIASSLMNGWLLNRSLDSSWMIDLIKEQPSFLEESSVVTAVGFLACHPFPQGWQMLCERERAPQTADIIRAVPEGQLDSAIDSILDAIATLSESTTTVKLAEWCAALEASKP